MITLYDMGPSSFPESMGGSPHVRKVIFTLNYKSLPFKITTLHFDSIEPTAKSLNAPPTTTKPDGSPKYTVPFIHDTRTGKSISDSFLIAEYLDKTYPDTPAVVPKGTGTLQLVFTDVVQRKMMCLMPVLMPKYEEWCSEELIESRRKVYGEVLKPPKISEEEERAVWESGRKTFGELAAAYVHSGNSVFVMGGDRPVFADFVVASMVVAIKVMFGEESEEWRDVVGWNEGRIGRLVEKVLGYPKVEV
ncbi:hypothetical protein E1B28_005346 [Marasmius oreades]|uniref:GST N-terminal domain-containing protein n=1 Tax=Marasmius oreades TaxID=181124 RepID=A0A9P7S3C2_9AGAR|nr:uncharacterized protein E1B28_005346 [Marasmius oreades]KAG7094515.1 hypothetical protein E1B28_005346 [Marasmius oreades]